MQILAERVGVKGCVIGVDIAETDPLPEPVHVFQLDMTQSDALEQIQRQLGERRAIAVLSDASPKLTGIKDVDRAAIEELQEAALTIAQATLVPKGALVIKGFPGPEAGVFRKRLAREFERVKEYRLEESRATSKEFYWVAGPKAPSSSRGRRRGRRSRPGRSS